LQTPLGELTAHSASPDPLAGFKGRTSKRTEGTGMEGEDKKMENKGNRKGEGNEGKE